MEQALYEELNGDKQQGTGDKVEHEPVNKGIVRTQLQSINFLDKTVKHYSILLKAFFLKRRNLSISQIEQSARN
jgi:hypothetical protein